MTKARDLADIVAAGSPLVDGTIEVVDITGVTASATELNYTDGVTSNIQTQVDSKLPLSGGTLTGALNFGDNTRLRLGDSQDFEIYFDSNNAIINETSGTGSLLLQGSHTRIKSGNGVETMAEFLTDGSVKLYYDNSLKLSTQNYGVSIDGTLAFNDNDKAVFGTSDDLQLFHDGSNSYIQNSTGNLILKNSTGDYLKGIVATGAVELNYNNSKKLETTSSGVDITGNLDVSGGASSTFDNFVEIKSDTNDTRIGFRRPTSGRSGWIGIPAWDDDALHIYGPTSSGNESAAYYAGSSWRFKYAGSDRLTTTSDGVTTNGNHSISDGGQYKFGAGGTRIAGSHTSNYITFHTNGGSEKVRIDSAGDVGIGTSNPVAKLHIVQTLDGSSNDGLRITSSSGNSMAIWQDSNGNTNFDSIGAGHQIFSTVNTERMRIGSSGELGIGGANYGTAGQVLTSGGSGAAPTWADAASGSSDPAVFYELTSDNINEYNARHFNRTDYVYVQSGTKIYSFKKSDQTTSVTTISGLKHVSFISDTLAVGVKNNAVFKLTISGHTITKGTETNLPSTDSGGNTIWSSDIAVGLSSTQAAVLCQYYDGSGGFYWGLVAVNISGSTPSVGSASTIYSSGQYQNVQWFGARVRNSNQFVCSGKHQASNGYSFAALVYVNGTNLSYHQFINTGNGQGPCRNDFALPPEYNEGDALPFIPHPGNDAIFVGPTISSSSYPNVTAIGFANTTSATVGYSVTTSSPSGADQASINYLTKLTPVSTTTNNNEYFVFQYIAYANQSKTVKTVAYRLVDNGSSLSASFNTSGQFSDSPYLTNTAYWVYDISGTNEFLNFTQKRGFTDQPMDSLIRKVEINTSTHGFTGNNVRQNATLPTSNSSDEFCITTIATYPLIKDGYQYLFETDFYAKSDDNWVTYTPGRMSTYVPYDSSKTIRVIDTNLAIVFDPIGTKIMEVL